MKTNVVLAAIVLMLISAVIMAIPILNGCPVEVGDELYDPSKMERVTVVGIDGWGSATSRCRVAVRRTNGTVDDWQFAFHFDHSNN